jgi:hypothetical protein
MTWATVSPSDLVHRSRVRVIAGGLERAHFVPARARVETAADASVDGIAAHELVAEPIRVDTIDRFWGGERDIVLLSLVASNPATSIGAWHAAGGG